MSETVEPFTAAVLVSGGRHPVSGAPRACRGDAIAMAFGHRLAGDRLRVVHVGSAEEASLRDYTALGAACIEVLEVPDGRDVVTPLAAHLPDVDIILTGARGEVGEGSGLLPYLLAHRLGRAVIAGVLEARAVGEEMQILQYLPKGKRRLIATRLPMVLAVHPLAPVALNYAHAKRVAGRVTPIEAISPARKSAWVLDDTARRPERLKAPGHKDGHARMLSYIQSPAKAGAVVFDGSPVDKAQILLTYLREHQLGDF